MENQQNDQILDPVIVRLLKKHAQSIETVVPEDNSTCLCGLQRDFGDCCKNKYSESCSQLYLENLKLGDFQNAKMYLHRWITWYRLSHLAHTIPSLKIDSKNAEKLLFIDIQSLGWALSELYNIYFRTNETKSLREIFERLKNAIADIRWHEKILFFQAFWKLDWLKDEEGAIKTIQKVKVDSTSDPEVLAGYLQMNSKNMTLEKRLMVIDKIISNSDDPGNILQYSVLRGIYLFFIREHEDGISKIKAATEKYKKEIHIQTDYGNYQLANATKTLGEFTGDTSFFEEARDLYSELLNKNHFTEIGKSIILREIGHCYRHSRKGPEAQEYYEKSLSIHPDQLTSIFLAESFNLQAHPQKAIVVLKSLQWNLLNSDEKYDFAFAWVHAAVISSDANTINEARRLLSELTVTVPIFEKQKDEALIKLLQIDAKSINSSWRNGIRLINDYVILKPSFFGIGLNVNEILKNISKVKKNKQ